MTHTTIDESEEGNSYRVCFLGASLEGGNRGVNALAASLVGLAVGRQPHLKVAFVGGGRSSKTVELMVGELAVPVRIVCYRFSPRAPLGDQIVWSFLLALVYRLVPLESIRKVVRNATPLLRTLSEADLVGDIWGGDSFSDIYGNRLLLISGLPGVIATMLGRPPVLLPQTYGPYKSRIARCFARWTLKRAPKQFARDLESQTVAAGLLGVSNPETEVPFSPDVAFTLEARKPAKVDFQPPIPPDDEKLLVGLNVSGLLERRSSSGENPFGFRCDYNEFVGKLATELLDRTDCRLLLIPHVFDPSLQDDFSSCKTLQEKLGGAYPDRIHLLHGIYDQNEIKGVIGGCDFFMGSRMHACIAAASQGIATIGLAYSRKFQGVFDSAGVGEMVVDLTKVTTEEAVADCLRLFERRDEAAKELAERIPKVKETVREKVGALFTR